MTMESSFHSTNGVQVAYDVTISDKTSTSICLESFTNGDVLISLPCTHSFHSLCLNPWLKTCGDCPYCLRAIAK
ncbi:hypothetical protein HID58_079318 [Brassica napus]|uniref:RING-type domain-containing protein n=1 Tax=Brassica napus TaxID=3708 RepID=A0ABQ7Y3C8_BRANA|nr:hypothetical protein HID58_079318 [Brassica napus]